MVFEQFSVYRVPKQGEAGHVQSSAPKAFDCVLVAA